MQILVFSVTQNELQHWKLFYTQQIWTTTNKKKQNHKKLRRHNSLIMDLQHQQTSNKSWEAHCSLFVVLWKKCSILIINFILSSHFSVIWFLWSFLKHCTTLQEEKISFMIIMNIHFSVSKFNWKSISQLLMCKSTSQRTNVMFEPRICFPQKLHLFYWIDSEHHCGKKVGKKCCWNHQTQLTQFFCFSGVSMRTRSMRWK